jgi:beta-glucosidase
VTVTIEVPADSCSLVTADNRRVVEPGDFELLVGPNSRESSLIRAGFKIS